MIDAYGFDVHGFKKHAEDCVQTMIANRVDAGWRVLP